MSSTLMLLFAAIELVFPAEKAVVPLLPDNQKTVLLKKTLEERVALFDESAKGDKKLCRGEWRKSKPFVVNWKATAGERGPWEVWLSKNPNLKNARIYDFEQDSKARGELSFDLKYVNLEVGCTYYWRVVSHGVKDVVSHIGMFATEALAPRWIALEGRVGNFRDLGGRRGLDGRCVLQGKIYRSGALNDVSPSGGRRRGRNRLFVEDVDFLTGELGIKTDLDLRRREETSFMKTSPLGESVVLVRNPLFTGGEMFSRLGKQAVASAFRVFLDRKNYPILFHCNVGSNRTGTLAYVLNGVLGVKQHELETDWESSYYPNIPYKVGGGEKLRSDCARRISNGFGAYGDAKTSMTDRIVLYLKDCGITDKEIAAFREIMLEE